MNRITRIVKEQTTIDRELRYIAALPSEIIRNWASTEASLLEFIINQQLRIDMVRVHSDAIDNEPLRTRLDTIGAHKTQQEAAQNGFLL